MGAVSFDTALPEITGGIPFTMLVHVSLPMFRASTSESLPSMYGTGQPSNAAGTEPLPGAWVALAGYAVQVALLTWLVEPVARSLLAAPTSRAR